MNKPDRFTLVFQREGKSGKEDFPSLDLCLHAANQMIAARAGLPTEIRKNGRLLMASASIYARLREFD